MIVAFITFVSFQENIWVTLAFANSPVDISVNKPPDILRLELLMKTTYICVKKYKASLLLS